jgi:D-xylose 1-dehydrogenase (NADP+, D-xylono-1,5-lactone-forming)
MATRILKWGILGTARINRALIPPLSISPRNKLLAVASRDLARAQAYAAEQGIERAHGSYEALLANPEVDVVYISLPNHLHAEWSIRAAAAGKHVLCEKPLALSVEDVDRVAEAARQYGVVIAEAFMYRHHPQTLKVVELINEGAIGRLQLVRGGFTFMLDRPEDIRLKPEMGGGSIWDVGCYPISYARTVAGGIAPEEVFGWQEVGPTGIDMAFFGQMRFPGGVIAQIDSGFNSEYRTVMEFIGDQGRITVPQSFKPDPESHLYLRKGDAPHEKIRFADPELYLGEVEDLYDAAVYGKPQRIPLSDTRQNIATIRSLLASAETGAPVKLE